MMSHNDWPKIPSVIFDVKEKCTEDLLKPFSNRQYGVFFPERYSSAPSLDCDYLPAASDPYHVRVTLAEMLNESERGITPVVQASIMQSHPNMRFARISARVKTLDVEAISNGVSYVYEAENMRLTVSPDFSTIGKKDFLYRGTLELSGNTLGSMVCKSGRR